MGTPYRQKACRYPAGFQISFVQPDYFFVSEEVDDEVLLEELEESELGDVEAGFDSLLLEPSFFDPLDDGPDAPPLPRA